jgi:hypothetical protein
MSNAVLAIAIAVVVYIEQMLNGNAPQWSEYIGRFISSQLSFSSTIAINHSITLIINQPFKPSTITLQQTLQPSRSQGKSNHLGTSSHQTNTTQNVFLPRPPHRLQRRRPRTHPLQRRQPSHHRRLPLDPHQNRCTRLRDLRFLQSRSRPYTFRTLCLRGSKVCAERTD